MKAKWSFLHACKVITFTRQGAASHKHLVLLAFAALTLGQTPGCLWPGFKSEFLQQGLWPQTSLAELTGHYCPPPSPPNFKSEFLQQGLWPQTPATPTSLAELTGHTAPPPPPPPLPDFKSEFLQQWWGSWPQTPAIPSSLAELTPHIIPLPPPHPTLNQFLQQGSWPQTPATPTPLAELTGHTIHPPLHPPPPPLAFWCLTAESPVNPKRQSDSWMAQALSQWRQLSPQIIHSKTACLLYDHVHFCLSVQQSANKGVN